MIKLFRFTNNKDLTLLIHNVCYFLVPKPLTFSVTLAGLTTGEDAKQLQNLLVWTGGKM